jgi:hypothetical protein
MFLRSQRQALQPVLNGKKYFQLGQEELRPEIEKGLEQKLDAMVKRELYTKYKTAPTEAEKEEARQKYLDKVGMLKDFRY